MVFGFWFFWLSMSKAGRNYVEACGGKLWRHVEACGQHAHVPAEAADRLLILAEDCCAVKVGTLAKGEK